MATGILEMTSRLLLPERRSTPVGGPRPGLCLWMDGGFPHPADLFAAFRVQSFVGHGYEDRLGMGLGS